MKEVISKMATWVFWMICVCCVSSQRYDCGVGWFGPSCQYKCRCTNDNCDENGLCVGSGICQRGWFGPKCQYADLAYESSSVLELTDGDDLTCITHNNSTVTINFHNLCPFTWLRVHVSNPEVLQNLTVLFREDTSLPCANQRNAPVDNTTMDIYCDVNEPVQTLTLAGGGVPYLCSVYVSGGRNVALKQKTLQSTTYSEWSMYSYWSTVSYSAEKSVDGNTNSNFYSGQSCSQTDLSQSAKGNWNVSFSQPRSVNRYVMYNPVDAQGNIFTGFSLQSLNETGTIVFTYTDRTNEEQQVYIITHDRATSLTVTTVQITTGSDDNVLLLCEVEVYGDSACEFGQHGFECEHACNCAGKESCYVTTGYCPAGCAPGFYGKTCNITCTPERYGLGCAGNCSKFCVKDSNDERSCDSATGTCLRGCQTGYRGATCTSVCEPETSGRGCLNNCSQFCAKATNNERPCDQVNGTCLRGCEAGYQGATCTTASSESSPPSSTITGLIIGICVIAAVAAVVIVLVTVYYRRKLRTSLATEDRSMVKISDIQDNGIRYTTNTQLRQTRVPTVSSTPGDYDHPSHTADAVNNDSDIYVIPPNEDSNIYEN